MIIMATVCLVSPTKQQIPNTELQISEEYIGSKVLRFTSMNAMLELVAFKKTPNGPSPQQTKDQCVYTIWHTDGSSWSHVFDISQQYCSRLKATKIDLRRAKLVTYVDNDGDLHYFVIDDVSSFEFKGWKTEPSDMFDEDCLLKNIEYEVIKPVTRSGEDELFFIYSKSSNADGHYHPNVMFFSTGGKIDSDTFLEETILFDRMPLIFRDTNFGNFSKAVNSVQWREDYQENVISGFWLNYKKGSEGNLCKFAKLDAEAFSQNSRVSAISRYECLNGTNYQGFINYWDRINFWYNVEPATGKLTLCKPSSDNLYEIRSYGDFQSDCQTKVADDLKMDESEYVTEVNSRKDRVVVVRIRSKESFATWREVVVNQGGTDLPDIDVNQNCYSAYRNNFFVVRKNIQSGDLKVEAYPAPEESGGEKIVMFR
jgi:hypothetical protein